jgi:hypothetical protein
MITSDHLRLEPTAFATLRLAAVNGQQLFDSLLAAAPDPWPCQAPSGDALCDILRSRPLAPVPPHWGLYLISKPHWWLFSEVVGLAAFLGPPDRDGQVALALSLDPSWFGRGYLAEAVDALTRCALLRPFVKAVISRSPPEEECRLYETGSQRLRFYREGTAALSSRRRR